MTTVNLDRLDTQVLGAVRSALGEGRLRLPSLPDVVMDVWDLLRNPKVRGEDLARVMQRDPVLSARLIAVANSAFYRRSRQVADVHQAVVLLGNELVRHTVAMLGVARLYDVRSDRLTGPHLNREWVQSTLVAGLSELLAREWGHLTTETALLAGMVHRIGVLPLLVLARREPRLVTDDRVREHLLGGLQSRVGVELLTSWSFPEELIAVVREHHDLGRETHGMVDYSTVVQGAVLVSYRGTSHPLGQVDWSESSAIAALGISEDDVTDLLDYCGPKVGELRSLLR